MFGTDREVILERDPANKIDPNAIKVIGRWSDSTGLPHEAQLGWVPAKVAAQIDLDVPIRATVEAMFRPRLGKIRLDVWGPRAKKKKSPSPSRKRGPANRLIGR